jgi:hypothetical protein
LTKTPLVAASADLYARDSSTTNSRHTLLSFAMGLSTGIGLAAIVVFNTRRQ